MSSLNLESGVWDGIQILCPDLKSRFRTLSLDLLLESLLGVLAFKSRVQTLSLDLKFVVRTWESNGWTWESGLGV